MSDKSKANKSFIAGSIGNVLEWYDFAVYGYFATIISSNFFPKEDKVVALIATFSIFAAGYLVRPLGGIIFGSMGDKYGRKKALTYSVFLMAIPTTLIGVIPTYHEIGFWAPAILTLLRLLQGLSVGGEFTGSISFVVETAPQNRRGLFGSFTVLGAVAGILLGSLIGSIMGAVFDHEALQGWAWRLPFFAGIVIGLAGYFLRRHMQEGEEFEQLKEEGKIAKSPIKEFWKDHKGKALTSALSLFCFSVSFYMIFLYLASYTHTFLKYSLDEALMINTLSMVLLVCLIPVMGHLSDKIGRKKVLIYGQIGFLIFTIPLFMLIDQAEYWHIFIAQACFAVLVATQQGAVPAMLVERFPTRIRYTGLAIAYNVGLAVFGGTTPMISTWLIHQFNENVMMPGYFLILSALISLIVLLTFRETYKDKLE
jgi:MHS family proline/betaine transporter-like MFS transporter